MANATYKKKYSVVELPTVSEGGSMTMKTGSMAAGMEQ